MLGSAIVATVALAGTAEYLQREPTGVSRTIAHRAPIASHSQRLAQTDPNAGAPPATPIQQSEIDEEQAEQQQQQQSSPPPPPPPPPPGR
jgi:hypothetical protein